MASTSADLDAMVAWITPLLDEVLAAIDEIESRIGLSGADERLLNLVELLDRALHAETAPAGDRLDPSETAAPVAGLATDYEVDLTDEARVLRHLIWEELVTFLEGKSDRDAVVFDALCVWVAREIRNGQPVPEPLSVFASDVVLGKRMRPASYARRSNTLARNRLFRDLIMSTVETFGVRLTRSDASYDRPSACDVLAEAMKGLKRKPESYAAIKRIWMSRQRSAW